MNVAVALAVLAMFDALLAGFRAAAGRDGRIDKRGYFRAALTRAAVYGVVLVGANAALTAALTRTATDPDATWSAFVTAGTACVWVFGAFATVTIGALAFWFSPIPETRLLASIVVLGPLTLLRPLVIVGGLAFGASRVADPRVWITAVVAGVTMLGLERWLGRAHAHHWRRLRDS